MKSIFVGQGHNYTRTIVFNRWIKGLISMCLLGLMIEINHGAGYSTRHTHAEKLLVDLGDIVKKGQNIALVGATGRSTGPQVHFEVYKNGRVVDPSTYIHRTVR
ncbi:MAG: hypothetical protein CMQ48_06350 [Gammaproteobacteria bacterium]|nr:hypothetical protein [Gammaproteobacteria bacterium]MBI91537.1 hypothetical protein [Gammaproteobacteria bacterium]HAI16458.1 hypothetical protein [Gammaproteobacteria bacterium]HBX99312.1 hypothetical protein [Gammaproteobacteria bacterium]